jgi:hypothetical protein
MSLPFVKRIRRWSSALAIAGGLGFAVQAQAQVQAQPPTAQAVSALPAKYVVRSATFHLPFKIGKAAQANVREMHLWMRDEAGRWKMVDRVPPSANHFTCRVLGDGEYGFSIVTVDRRGVATPKNITQQPPELLVIVETRPQTARPALDADFAPVTPAASIQAAAGTETSLPVPPLARATGNQSGNQPLPSLDETVVPASEPGALPMATDPIPGVPPSEMTIVNTPLQPALRPAPTKIAPEIAESTSVNEEQLLGMTMPSTIGGILKSPGVSHVNNTRLSVEYNVGKAGPSGLAKVMIYSTTDQGRTWECLGTDPDLHSPAEITLPGEGTYGIRMVGVNGNGFGGKAPAAGEQPATTIEVDLTRPKVQGWNVALTRNGHLDIRWKVSDKNLGNQPISLFYRTGCTGPWKSIADKIKNDGSFRWSIAHDLAPQYYIRLEATDLAGNMAFCETQNAIFVDRTEPDINVTGVTVIHTRPHEPANHLVPASGEVHEE